MGEHGYVTKVTQVEHVAREAIGARLLKLFQELQEINPGPYPGPHLVEMAMKGEFIKIRKNIPAASKKALEARNKEISQEITQLTKDLNSLFGLPNNTPMIYEQLRSFFVCAGLYGHYEKDPSNFQNSAFSKENAGYLPGIYPMFYQFGRVGSTRKDMEEATNRLYVMMLYQGIGDVKISKEKAAELLSLNHRDYKQFDAAIKELAIGLKRPEIESIYREILDNFLIIGYGVQASTLSVEERKKLLGSIQAKDSKVLRTLKLKPGNIEEYVLKATSEILNAFKVYGVKQPEKLDYPEFPEVVFVKPEWPINPLEDDSKSKYVPPEYPEDGKPIPFKPESKDTRLNYWQIIVSTGFADNQEQFDPKQGANQTADQITATSGKSALNAAFEETNFGGFMKEFRKFFGIGTDNAIFLAQTDGQNYGQWHYRFRDGREQVTFADLTANNFKLLKEAYEDFKAKNPGVDAKGKLKMGMGGRIFDIDVNTEKTVEGITTSSNAIIKISPRDQPGVEWTFTGNFHKSGYGFPSIGSGAFTHPDFTLNFDYNVTVNKPDDITTLTMGNYNFFAVSKDPKKKEHQYLKFSLDKLMTNVNFIDYQEKIWTDEDGLKYTFDETFKSTDKMGKLIGNAWKNGVKSGHLKLEGETDGAKLNIDAVFRGLGQATISANMAFGPLFLIAKDLQTAVQTGPVTYTVSGGEVRAGIPEIGIQAGSFKFDVYKGEGLNGGELIVDGSSVARLTGSHDVFRNEIRVKIEEAAAKIYHASSGESRYEAYHDLLNSLRDIATTRDIKLEVNPGGLLSLVSGTSQLAQFVGTAGNALKIDFDKSITLEKDDFIRLNQASIEFDEAGRSPDKKERIKREITSLVEYFTPKIAPGNKKFNDFLYDNFILPFAVNEMQTLESIKDTFADEAKKFGWLQGTVSRVSLGEVGGIGAVRSTSTGIATGFQIPITEQVRMYSMLGAKWASYKASPFGAPRENINLGGKVTGVMLSQQFEIQYDPWLQFSLGASFHQFIPTDFSLQVGRFDMPLGIKMGDVPWVLPFGSMYVEAKKSIVSGEDKVQIGAKVIATTDLGVENGQFWCGGMKKLKYGLAPFMKSSIGNFQVNVLTAGPVESPAENIEAGVMVSPHESPFMVGGGVTKVRGYDQIGWHVDASANFSDVNLLNGFLKDIQANIQATHKEVRAGVSINIFASQEAP